MKRLFVMDGHSHLFRAYHAVGYLSTSKGVPSHAVLILSTMLWKLIREEQPDYLAIAWDPTGPTFRDALSAEYKATRSAMPDDLVRQLPYVRRLFEALRTPVLEVPGFEADDVLAWALARNGRCGEALRFSKRALRLGSLDAPKFFHRGMIERCLRRPDAARTWFTRALETNPHFSLLWAPAARRYAA